MQQRLARGIQYEDVAQAADALLQEGTRPTIERIRLRIGRGSPNTVSPMLEQWFGRLGQRLGTFNARGQGGDVPAIPDAVLQMAQTLWEKASSEAKAHSELACAAERARLDSEAQQMQEAKAQLEMRELAMKERLRTMEEALQLCTQQLGESNERWQVSQRTLAAQEAEITANRSALERSRGHASALQQRLDVLQNQAKEERAAMEKRHQDSERRWLAEVDRARQETRKSTLLVQDGERRLNALQQEADNLRAVHHAEALEQTLQITALRHDLASARRSAEQSKFLLQEVQLHAAKSQEAAFKAHLINRRTPPVRRKLGKKRP